MTTSRHVKVVPVRDYDLAATLDSGQAFRWERREQSFTGVIGRRWVRLEPLAEGLRAETAEPVHDWQWLTEYLQSGVDLGEVIQAFPDDPPLQQAVAACRGLRLLRQEPWECLVSFMLSATKQIVQIRQIIALLCERHGAAVDVPAGESPAFAFPTPGQLAGLSEAQLRACKMGFRAPNVLADARAAVAVHGLEVSPVSLQQRAPFAHALTAGQTAHEYEPDGKAAEEVTQLYAWLWNELSNSIA